MRSQIDVPRSYTLTTTQTDSRVDAILKSTSGDYVCTFTGGTGDASGFTFGTTGGRFWCEPGGKLHGLVCANGMQRDMEALGHTLSGRISGNDISGTWGVSWVVTPADQPSVDIALETTTQYTGTR
jgi:hypothetical protein